MLNPFVMTKLMLNARRAPLDRTPADVGLEFEDAAFPAADGIGLKGWFIPSGAEGRGPAVVFVHGWMWNRLGNVAHQVKGLEDADVDFLPAAKALHDAGYHVLLFDVRWHGESERSSKPLSYGPVEARDYIGAVRYLRSRPDVDGERIGAIGTSMGGNIVLYGTPEAQPIKAILAIQPTRLAVFNNNFMRTEMGPLGPPMTKPMESCTPPCAPRGPASTTPPSRPANSATRSSSTSRARATRGGGWTSSRSSPRSRPATPAR